MSPAGLVPWLVAAMRAWAPTEAPAELARYAAFASDVAVVAIERPIAGTPAETAALLLAIASFESGGFREDVMRCRVTGDGGRSLGPFQTQRASRTVCTDHKAAARIALDRIEESWALCGRGELAGYTAGRCSSTVGRRIGARYVARARQWLRAAPLLEPVS